MTTKQELANDPDIIALSAMNDVTFRLLSPLLRNVVQDIYQNNETKYDY